MKTKNALRIPFLYFMIACVFVFTAIFLALWHSGGGFSFLPAALSLLAVSCAAWQAGVARQYKQELRAAAGNAQASQDYLAAFLDNARDGFIVTDSSGIVHIYNKACEKIFGRDAAEMTGRNISALMPEGPAAHHDGYLRHYLRTGNSKIIGTGRELEGCRKDGSAFPIELSVAEMHTGGQKMFIGIVRDITARKAAEEALKRTNKELEQFAYIASHDLRAPLRGIDNLARWVIEDAGDALTPDAREKLHIMHGRIGRLDGLLQDILKYSRAGRITGTAEDVDVKDMICGIAGSAMWNTGFEIVMTRDIPVMTTLRTPLEQVFTNLIDNAVKHHDQSSGVVSVNIADAGKFYEFSVSDDGPGIPRAYHDRIFGMFHTLQSRDRKEGSGLGLSIVKKLVEWQGGRVWVVSDEARRGTAFHFLWPKICMEEQVSDAA